MEGLVLRHVIWVLEKSSFIIVIIQKPPRGTDFMKRCRVTGMGM